MPAAWLGFAGFLVFWVAFVLLVVIDLRHTLVPLRYAALLISAALIVCARPKRS